MLNFWCCPLNNEIFVVNNIFLQMLSNTFDPIPSFDMLKFCMKASEVNHNDLPKMIEERGTK